MSPVGGTFVWCLMHRNFQLLMLMYVTSCEGFAGAMPKVFKPGQGTSTSDIIQAHFSNKNNLCLVIGSGRYSGGSILNLHHSERVRLLLKAGCSSLVIQATGCFPPHLVAAVGLVQIEDLEQLPKKIKTRLQTFVCR